MGRLEPVVGPPTYEPRPLCTILSRYDTAAELLRLLIFGLASIPFDLSRQLLQ